LPIPNNFLPLKKIDMTERLNSTQLEQELITFKRDTTKDWYGWNIKDFAREIGSGYDSIVFPYGKDKVVKIYKGSLSFLPQLELYQEITNEGSKLCKKENHSIQIHGRSFRVFINPINFVYAFGQSDTLCAISKRIPGKRLYDTNLTDIDTINQLNVINFRLDEKLGVKGISLIDGNIKVVNPYIFPKLTVTDLCSSIDCLKKK
jgi:hypothetical protein